jgi:hypothetical protein
VPRPIIAIPPCFKKYRLENGSARRPSQQSLPECVFADAWSLIFASLGRLTWRHYSSHRGTD